MNTQPLSLSDGQYTIFFDDCGIPVKAYRDGAPWLDIQGDNLNLIYALCKQLEAVQNERTFPFVTGSFAYGAPKASSDIDIVMSLNDEVIELLSQYSEGDNPHEYSVPEIRFGRLNIIVVKYPMEWRIWYDATQQLKEKRRRSGKPIGKEEAHNLIDPQLKTFYRKKANGLL